MAKKKTKKQKAMSNISDEENMDWITILQGPAAPG